MVRIYLRLRLLLERRLELWRLVDDREAVFIDCLLARFLECQFLDRNDLPLALLLDIGYSPYQ